MEIGDWKASPTLSRVYKDVRGLGLEHHVAELEAFGFTVVPPESMGDGVGELVERLTTKLVELSADRNNGIKPDIEGGTTHTDMLGPTGQHLFYLLGEDQAFVDALMHPVVQALVTYLMGDQVILSSCTSILKGPGRRPLFLHSDSPLFTGRQAQVCNATLLLTDYSKENGSICFVPGSHHQNRQPTMGENFTSFQKAAGNLLGDWGVESGTIDEAPGAVPVEAPAGSLVVWHGNTWHGAYNRINPGIRMAVVYYFCSAVLRPQEPYREFLPQDVIDANGDRFAVLMGKNITNGWMAEGPERMPGAAFKRHRDRAQGVTV